jgi:hypothetical protein
MQTSGEEVARLSGQQGWTCAEGFRRHSHVGFSTEDLDLLSEVLDNHVTRRNDPPAH